MKSLDRILNALKKKPTSEEQTVIDSAYKKADPTSYSPLPLRNIEVVNKKQSHGYDLVEEKGEPGQRYYNVTEKSLDFLTSTEQVVARLVKGVINVSDVVTDKNGKHYYSKVMPLDRIDAPTSDAEFAADVTIFQQIFSDWDHHFPDRNISSNHNLALNEEGRAVHYDFGKARYLFYTPEAAREFVGISKSPNLDDEAKRVLLRKISALTDRFRDRAFIEAVIHASGDTLFELFEAPDPEMKKVKDPIGLLQETLLSRLEALRESCVVAED